MVMLPECIIEIRIERMPRQADKKTTGSLWPPVQMHGCGKGGPPLLEGTSRGLSLS